jgi:hypothetical protein
VSHGNHDTDEEYPSPQDMRLWAQQEIKDVTKAVELRIRELTDLVTNYSAGEITPKEADERKDRYEHRWGEALRGCSTGPNVTDEEILTKIDGTRTPYISPDDRQERLKRRFPKASNEERLSR